MNLFLFSPDEQPIDERRFLELSPEDQTLLEELESELFKLVEENQLHNPRDDDHLESIKDEPTLNSKKTGPLFYSAIHNFGSKFFPEVELDYQERTDDETNNFKGNEIPSVDPSGDLMSEADQGSNEQSNPENADNIRILYYNLEEPDLDENENEDTNDEHDDEEEDFRELLKQLREEIMEKKFGADTDEPATPQVPGKVLVYSNDNEMSDYQRSYGEGDSDSEDDDDDDIDLDNLTEDEQRELLSLVLDEFMTRKDAASNENRMVMVDAKELEKALATDEEDDDEPNTDSAEEDSYDIRDRKFDNNAMFDHQKGYNEGDEDLDDNDQELLKRLREDVWEREHGTGIDEEDDSDALSEDEQRELLKLALDEFLERGDADKEDKMILVDAKELAKALDKMY